MQWPSGADSISKNLSVKSGRLVLVNASQGEKHDLLGSSFLGSLMVGLVGPRACSAFIVADDAKP